MKIFYCLMRGGVHLPLCLACQDFALAVELCHFWLHCEYKNRARLVLEGPELRFFQHPETDREEGGVTRDI